ncbi:hypothetical protein OIU76_021824 [Salix suchowensis]|uniref:Peptidase A1 domain-containing protein n=1 Tax=Salix suchowensis TaxID=1278906 RepID=A0ABQ9CC84_9ROSI|nr:hypothetical protein OIU76_021824 [Salix suchowensis]KAJ6396195.1 hypothetical protein OIU77_021264 [Salix suchowensis]
MSSCRGGQCLYQVNYGDGSYTLGDFATESVSLGNSRSVKNVALGCGHDHNEGLFVGAAVTAPLVKYRKIDTFYYVGLSGMSVGGQMVSIPESAFRLDESGNGGIIVDCGTSITRLQTQAYNPLRDAFKRMTQNLELTSAVALLDTCYDLSGQKCTSPDGVVSLHRWELMDFAGRQLFDPCGFCWDFLLCVCSSDVVFVYNRECATAGDTCHL